jgi:superfamily II DNA/RNA helicase
MRKALFGYNGEKALGQTMNLHAQHKDAAPLSRSELAMRYIEQLPYPPYPVQEEALLAWFTSEQGVMVCAPTGTGKTLIAQAAMYEALHTGKVAYYTTPLIALTEQKFAEMQAAAVRWGFTPEDVGLVTGNRRVNPQARVLVVVAEILLNRLLHPEGFHFENVSSVVMDEFHSFADPERGIVWELTLNLLPRHVRLLLLSATVGNSFEFLHWLANVHGRQLELVESTERKVPLTYRWVPDKFLNELLLEMAQGDEDSRKLPALVFVFNRDECWTVAEQLKGLDLMTPRQKAAVNRVCDQLDWSHGAGPKLKQMLRRGIGVHHAGVLPKYRRVVEDLFERKLLSVALCTETLAAGINLPARSVVLTSLVKGPFGKERLIDASTAHQIFGRAGRPQYDKEGFVFVLADEDDVRILRWKQQYEQIPDTTKDPVLLKKKKELLRKKPTRNTQKKYWNEAEFEKLRRAPPARLYSKGPLPWRLLAYLLSVSPDVDTIRSFVRKRLLDGPRVEAGLKQLRQMLLTLHRKGFVELAPPPPPELIQPQAIVRLLSDYQPALARPTPELPKLLAFRGCHPLYGVYLLDWMAEANREERIQLLESLLDLPRPLLRLVRVPFDLSGGPLERNRLDPELIQRGLLTVQLPQRQRSVPTDDPDDSEADSTSASELDESETDEEEGRLVNEEGRPLVLAEKVRCLFDELHPDVTDLETQAVWVAGDVLRYGDFNKYVTTRDLVKQEGLIFRHLLRMILLLEEFAQLTPPGMAAEEWRGELRDIARQLTGICHAVDPTSTQQAITKAHAADLVEGEAQPATTVLELPSGPDAAEPAIDYAAEIEEFQAGILD